MWEFYVRYNVGTDSLEAWLFRRRVDGTRDAPTPMTLVVVDPKKGEIVQPWIEADPGADNKPMFQAVMDGLWAHGFRPKGFSDTTEQVKAIKEHRDDLRTIAFRGLGISQGG